MKSIVTGALIAGSLLCVATVLGQHSGAKREAGLAPGSVDFSVSSTADAGPGSLRDAILAADRLGERAHIVITARQITLDSALPALINPKGIALEAAAGAGTLDASRLVKGATLQINAKASVVRGLHIVNAHALAFLVSAAGVEFDDVTVTASKTGIQFSGAARGCVVRASTFENDETGIIAEPGADDIAVLDTTFRNDSRAGFWFVGAAGHDASAAPNGAREHARIVNGTFDKNASGVVLANQSTLIQKSHFSAQHESAILVLSGMARIEDNEIRSSDGTAISVVSGRHVVVSRNRLLANRGTALSVRDSQATIDHNVFQDNGFAIVSILGDAANPTSIVDNEISKSSNDAVTLIGGSVEVERNQIFDNHGAALRILDFASPQGVLKATPHLNANVLTHNGSDSPQTGTYKVAAVVH